MNDLEPRNLCLILFDVSESMIPEITFMNKSLHYLIDNFGKDSGREYAYVTKENLHFGIIEFDSSVRVLRNPSLLDGSIKDIIIESKGNKKNVTSAIIKAIDIVEAWTTYNKNNGFCYERPTIFLLTDGNINSNDQILTPAIKNIINTHIIRKKMFFIVIGLGNHLNETFLYTISNNGFIKIKNNNPTELCRIVNESINYTRPGYALTEFPD